MNLTLFSWNGDTRINDSVNFNGLIVPGQMINLTNQAVYVDRAENFPYLSGVVLPAHAFQINLVLPNSATPNQLPTQRELLKSIFNITDFTPHNLIAKDENNKQWQLTGFPVSLTKDPKVTADTSFLITLAVTEPVWSSVTVNSDTWNITASGQQRTIAVAGNILNRPTFTITPTANRTGQYLYSRWSPIYNRAITFSAFSPLTNYPVEITNGGINTATLVNDTTVSNQINQGGGIAAGDTTIPINTAVGGGLPNSGMGYIGTEQISWTSNTGGTSLTGVTRGIGGTTPAAHANSSVIARSKMLANGNDLVVQVDGTLANRWIDGINTATTKVWINGNWSSRPADASNATTTLLTALPNNSTPVTVEFPPRINASQNLLATLLRAPNQCFMIDNEAFTYLPGNIDFVNFRITNCSRAQKFTSAAAHSVGASVIWIEHDIWLLYGNSAATAPNVDDTKKPLLDLHNSTNTSWVFANYRDSNSNRSGAWYGAIVQSTGKQSFVYSGNQEAFANPATEMGFAMLDYQLYNVWKAETCYATWSFYHPCGISTVSASGSKRTTAASAWPALIGLQAAPLGSWNTIWIDAVPASPNVWTALAAHSNISLGATSNYIRFIIQGTIPAAANNKVDIQWDTITLALDNTRTPVVSLQQENSNQYYLAMKLTNTTTGDYIVINYSVMLNQALTVNCQLKTVTFVDGSNAVAALTPSTIRNDWLTLAPNTNNVLQFDDVGTAGLTIQTQWQDRTL